MHLFTSPYYSNVFIGNIFLLFNVFISTDFESEFPAYQNSGCRSYEVTLKAGCRGYGMSGVAGSAGAYDVGARTRPQLIGCALASRTRCP